MMNFGWSSDLHRAMTTRVVNSLPFSVPEKDQIIEGSVEPDNYHPFNSMDHFQTPSKGNAKNAIIQEFNKNTLKGLGHAIHFTQDICNPFHTIDTGIIKHIAYEASVRDLPKFEPDKTIEIFQNGIPDGIDKIVSKSHLGLMETKNYLSIAVYATYELCLLWLRSNGRNA